MSRYAMCNPQGVVMNVIEWDGQSYFEMPNPKFKLVTADEGMVSTGSHWDEATGVFSHPGNSPMHGDGYGTEVPPPVKPT